MRAAIYNGKKNILMTELETPTVGDNDIVTQPFTVKGNDIGFAV